MAGAGLRAMQMMCWVGLMFGASAAFAQDKSSGCGPGWYVTKTISFSGTTTRATTNSYVQPFAMTSGTSGCAKHSIVSNHRRLEFIAANKEALALETALGQGEYLTALSASLGCSPDLGGSFNAALRSHYTEVFAQNSDASQVLASVERVVGQDPALVRCVAPVI